MRDIDKYETEYVKPDFETYLVEQRRKKVLESIKGKRTILEIGCGLSPLFLYTDWNISSFTVFEPGKKFAENAINYSRNFNYDIQIINKFFSAKELTEDLFCDYEAIVCSGLLHEVESPIDLLNEIHKVASDNSLIHINVPNSNSFHRLIAKEMGLIKDEKELSDRNIKLQQHNVFDIDDLIKMCLNCGFKVVESGSYFIKPFTHEQMYKMMKQNIINEKILDGLYDMSKYMPKFGAEIYVNCVKS